MFVIQRTPMIMANFEFINLDIKVLGPGCAKCKTLDTLTRRASEELALKANIEKIEDYQKIMEYGVMSTPGLVINNELILSGKVPNYEELKKILVKFS